MREELQRLCDEFIQRKEILKKVFAWENSYIYPVCASIVMDKSTVTEEILKKNKQMIKDKTGIFSEFRGNLIAPMACKLALSGDAEALLDDTLKIYDMFRKDYMSSSYMPLVALIVAEFGDRNEYEGIVKKAKEIYENMKKNHPFLTSGEDGPFAAMLALCEKSPEYLTQEMEECYGLLRDRFLSGNAVQSLSHVLVMGEGSAQAKCDKFMKLFDALKAKGYKYNTDYYLPTLGALSVLPVDVEVLVEDVIAATDYLEGKPGYGFFGASQKERMVHAAMLVSKDYLAKCVGQVMDTATIGSTIAAISMIVAQQAAMCAIIASTAATTASN